MVILKKYHLVRLTTILSVIALISCGEKEDPMLQSAGNGNPPTIIGEWMVNTTTLQLSVNGQPLKDYLVSTGRSQSEAQNDIDIIRNQAHWEGLFKSFDFKADGNWAVTTNNETGSGVGTWEITDDQRELMISPANADEDMIASVSELTNSNLQFGIRQASQPKFGTTVDYLVLVKATRPNN